ncbi:MAG: hypothetical protein Q7T86_16960 [Hyphomicrobiaceae bacterium]|nr:hypothetical protein [Hyphomicrobiaceae bacterium]
MISNYDEIHNITSKDQLAGSLKNNNTIQPDKKITSVFRSALRATAPAIGITTTAPPSRMPRPTARMPCGHPKRNQEW